MPVPRSELFPRICGFCNKPVLRTLAVTSRTLSEPALRCLWATLDAFVPLLYTLPRDAWISEEMERPVPGRDSDTLKVIVRLQSSLHHLQQ